ncbi:P-loop containing nucleoside triphosphate hydrolase protein [Gigaspora margarita]|uniref:P-loop containing nucleoside triphosphate hydrolase protein n=1 Tax=Gigaspora margarita TaxID=4874 RepID=A0A8H4EQU7_GIGMA|nr:P-loop containing nucleoside triphosphate hydrolase protein [Gigaspora margarita]
MSNIKNFDDESLRWNWKWSCFEETKDHYRVERKAKVDNEQTKAVPFNVVYSQYEKTYVELNSAQLIEILRNLLPDYRNLHKEKPKINALDLYHVMDQLSDISENHSDPKTKCHVYHLNEFLKYEHKDLIKLHTLMLKSKTVSFDMLWVFYTANLNVWYRCGMSGQQVGGIISSALEKQNDCGKYFEITLTVVDCDGNGFKRCSIVRRIREFDGQRSFSDLPVVPFKFSNAYDFLKESIVKNGSRFFELALGNRFMQYEGSLMRRRVIDGCMQIEKLRADGRVMIDLRSFATMNPQYDMGNAKPPNKGDVELYNEKGVYLEKDEIPLDDNYFLASAVVYGFSFALKEWGMFEVSKFSDIHFDEDAIDHLVISQNKKDMLTGLVRQYGDLKKTNIQLEKTLDPISNKGNGCIFLCYGPPGTGKTLTAECVAEFLRRPLWNLTIHELGTKAKELEENLTKVLDIAHKWRAVLLLDEADIYLEKRDTLNIERNAMVGVFLRLLEYYQGVLFLTTNRVTNFDDAICSRVSMFFHYPKLNEKERLGTWANFIRRGNLPFKADDFVNYELNGREIRNVIHIARKLAQDKGTDLSSSIMIDVIETVLGFQNEKNRSKITTNGVNH